MPSVQEDGGLSPAERAKIIAEERLRSQVRQQVEIDLMREISNAEMRSMRGVYKRIAIYITVGIFVLAAMLALRMASNST